MAAGIEVQAQQSIHSTRTAPAASDTALNLSLDKNVRKFPSTKFDVYQVDRFLDACECRWLVQLVSETLRTSTITIPSADPNFRTSSTSDLSLLQSGALSEIDQRISRLLGVPLEFSEGVQGQHYAQGEQFKLHTDFFTPGGDEYRTYGAERGNRTWTFMVYLNEVAAGGGTRFPALDHVFRPEPGMALVWNNLEPDGSPNPRAEHAGLPVFRGEKFIITKWFRQYAL